MLFAISLEAQPSANSIFLQVERICELGKGVFCNPQLNPNTKFYKVHLTK